MGLLLVLLFVAGFCIAHEVLPELYANRKASKKARKSFTLGIAALVAVIVIGAICLVCLIDDAASSSSSKQSSSSQSDKGGFVGSDGEYHPYIPEFGDDVNNWMEENW